MTNRILVVEDDPTSRVLLASMLADMGYGVVSAASGDEGLRYIYSEESCDLVLSDIVMGGMSGIEFAQRTRDARPGLPFVFVTGVPGAIDGALNVGAVALPKPITRDSLCAILNDALAD